MKKLILLALILWSNPCLANITTDDLDDFGAAVPGDKFVTTRAGDTGNSSLDAFINPPGSINNLIINNGLGGYGANSLGINLTNVNGVLNTTEVINNAGTAATYTILSSDMAKTVLRSRSSSMTDGLPQAGTSGFNEGLGFTYKNIGTGTAFLTPAVSTIDGATSAVVSPHGWLYAISYAGNWITLQSSGVSYVSGCTYPLPSGANIVSFAYGLRLLDPGYAATTKLVRVQRASDNTQTDIGTINSCDLDTATFNTFCNATTCFVAKWYDQSGNGFDVTQATLANMPQITLAQQNGHPGITFNGTSSVLKGNLSGNAGTSASFAAVGATGSSFPSGTRYMFSVATDVTHNWGLQVRSTSPNCTASKTNGSGAATASIACSTSTWYRWLGRFNPNLASIYLDGNLGSSNASAYSLTVGTNINIGNAITDILYWNGTISEVISFTPEATDSDGLNVSLNQGAYWGL